MHRFSSARIGYVPRPNPTISTSRVMPQPYTYEHRTSRVNPWTTTSVPVDFNSSSSTQWTKSYENFYNQSSLNSLNSNNSKQHSLKKPCKLPKNITNKEMKHPFWSLIFLVMLFAMVSLAALATGIYAVVRIETVLKTTVITTTSAVTPNAALLFRWNSSGTTIAGVTGVPGNAPILLNVPYGLAFDTSGALYVAEWSGNRVTKWTSGSSSGITVAGQASGTASATANNFNAASDVVLDSSNNCYVTDASDHRVQFWAVGSTTGITLAGTSGVSGTATNQLNTPYSLAIDPRSNTLYISDTGNHRVMRYFAGDPNGTPGTSSILLCQPMDVILDPMGNMYVADGFNNRVQFFLAGSTNGTTIAGLSVGTGPTQLLNPFSVILDNDLNLYVADASNHRVQRFNRY